MRGRSAILALVAVLAIAAAACGGNGETGGGGTPTASATTGEPLPEFTTLQEGVLTVGSCLDYAPFETVEGGDEVGFDVDLSEEIAKRLGLTVKWVTADFDTIFTAVAADQFDMVAAAVTATGKDGEERDQVVDFSDFYFNSRQSLTVNSEQTPDITSTDDLGEGDIVGAQKGTTGLTWARDNLEPQGVEIKTFQTAPDAFRDLEAGNIQGVINDEQSSVGIIEDLPALEVVEPIDTNEKYAFPFSPSNPELREAVDIVLKQIIDDGTYAEIFEKYFPGQEVPPEYQPAG
ncbi:MAG TPA: transporter substrate-binding domain-containing protein [Actinomycetota bacterium]|nr:transporter substrate-binding domain-containing protein [Actinomycetota bacterium]